MPDRTLDPLSHEIAYIMESQTPTTYHIEWQTRPKAHWQPHLIGIHRNVPFTTNHKPSAELEALAIQQNNPGARARLIKERINDV